MQMSSNREFHIHELDFPIMTAKITHHDFNQYISGPQLAMALYKQSDNCNKFFCKLQYIFPL